MGGHDWATRTEARRAILEFVECGTTARGGTRVSVTSVPRVAPREICRALRNVKKTRPAHAAHPRRKRTRGGSISGHEIATPAKRVATPITYTDDRAGRAPVRTLCRQIQSQLPATAISATGVVHACARSIHANTPPPAATRTAGSARGNTQHATHAPTASPDVVTAVPPAVRSAAGTLPRPGGPPLGRLQDGAVDCTASMGSCLDESFITWHPFR